MHMHVSVCEHMCTYMSTGDDSGVKWESVFLTNAFSEVNVTIS